MRTTLEPPPEPGAAMPPLWKRLLWFGGLAITGAASCAVIAFALKVLLR